MSKEPNVREKMFFNAVRKGDVDAVDEFIAEKSMKVDTEDAAERTALWHAAAGGDADMIMILFKHDANANHPDREGITPLMAAVNRQQWAAAKALLEMADINARAGEKGFTALHSAIWTDMGQEKTSRVKFLMENWADAYLKDKSGKSAVETAQELASKWPFAQQFLDLIEEYKDGPVARQQYLDRKRDEGIKAALQGTTVDLAAPAQARWKPKLAR